MAFSTTEQNKIVQLLGYGGKVLQANSVLYDGVLVNRLATPPTDTENLIRSYLAQVAAIETQMNAAPLRLSAEKVDDLTINLRELPLLRAERRRIVREMSQHLDIPMVASGGVNVSVRV